MTAEQLAICWSLVWAVDTAPSWNLPVMISFDCTSAGYGAFGISSPPGSSAGRLGPDSTATPLSDAATLLRFCACELVQLTHRHVKGHSGVLENELSDQLAKAAARVREPSTDRCLPTWPKKVLTHRLRDWAWSCLRVHPDLPALPALAAEAARLQADVRPAPPPPCNGAGRVSAGEVNLRLGFVSYNVLTLLDPVGACRPYPRAPACTGMRLMGKRDLLKRQFLEAGYHFVGLQETRLSETCVLPDADFLMFSAAATASGTLGVSLWIRKNLPFAVKDGRPLCIQMRHVTVVSTCPRHLLASVSAPHLDFHLLVAHAPHDCAVGESNISFWQRMRALLARPGLPGPLVVLADANGHLGSELTPAVGDVCPENENVAGEQFHLFLLAHGLCLPSTFRDCHDGESWTWVGPKETRHRLDYIAVPQAWRSSSVTKVWHALESMQRRDDHFPVVLCCELLRQSRTTAFALPPQRHALRPGRDWQPQHSLAFLEAVRQAPPLSWDLDVDTHYDRWVEQWTMAWDTCRPCLVSCPRQAYLTADTYALVQSRQAFRIFAHAEEASLRRHDLLRGYAAFLLTVRGQRASVVSIDRWRRQRRLIALGLARVIASLQRSARHIRLAVRRDRQTYLQGLRDAVASGDMRDPKQLYACIRKAFPQARSSRKATYQPLPQVRLEDGSLALTSAQRAARWHDHFAQQEGAETIAPAEYPLLFAEQRFVPPCDGCFSVPALPTLRATEATLLRLQRGKACGVDGITAELLRLDVPTASRSLLPVMLKAALGAREPTAWRGGHLVVLAKKAGAALDCASFRSILISSLPAKIYHRHVRQCLAPALAGFQGPLQCGTLPGPSTDGLLLLARVVQHLGRRRSHRTALVFFDVRAAYYRLVRQLVIGMEETDAAMHRLLATLDLPSRALEELRGHLANMAAIPSAGTEAHAAKLAADLYRGTWFRLDQQAAVAFTRRGSRPGDPVADLVYAFSLAALNKALDGRLAAAGLLYQVPPTATQPLADYEQSQQTVDAASWADDMLRFAEAPDVAQLLDKVSEQLRICFEGASAMGIQFATGRHKTAVLISDAHPGGMSRNDRLHPPTSLPVFDALSGTTHAVDVVPAYRYLGGVLTSDLSSRLEVRYRRSLALGTAKPLVSKFFSCPAFALPLRRHLLRSLVMSRFYYGSTALHLTTALDRRVWHQAYVALWRVLLRRDKTGKQPHAFAVLATADAPAPSLSLAYARATLLQKLVMHGPQVLLALLQLHWESDPTKSWLGQLAGDVALVAQFTPAARLVLQTRCCVRAVFESMVEEPHWWRRTVWKACLQSRADHAHWVQGRRMGLVPALPSQVGGPDATTRPHVCHDCGAAFTFRKHLCAHLANIHGVLSPARHFAVGPFCVSCHRWFHTVRRAQSHLKQASRCLHRAARLLAPIGKDDISLLEADCKRQEQALRRGAWSAFEAAAPAQALYGPPLPTLAERHAAIDESWTVADLAYGFRPDADTLQWIDSYLAGQTTEGKRVVAADFWHRRQAFPLVTSFVSPACSIFGTRPNSGLG